MAANPRLTPKQVELLQPFEGGYEMIEVDVQLAASKRALRAFTYISELITPGLRPLDSYVEHYLCGMLENDFPPAYVESIRRQAKR